MASHFGQFFYFCDSKVVREIFLDIKFYIFSLFFLTGSYLISLALLDKATLAASCSASFLLLPLPLP